MEKKLLVSEEELPNSSDEIKINAAFSETI